MSFWETVFFTWYLETVLIFFVWIGVSMRRETKRHKARMRQLDVEFLAATQGLDEALRRFNEQQERSR